MTNTLDTLHVVGEEEVAASGAVLARAFEHDPVWSEVFAGIAADQMAVWFQGPARYCGHFGRMYATSERLEGLMGVVPGDVAEMTMRRTMQAGMMRMNRQIDTRTGLKLMLRGPRILRTFAPLDRDRKRHMGDRDFTYVMIVGVDPEHQGQGHGGSLLRALMAESDRTGVPIYLETETPGNRDMYEHYGFRTLEEIVLPVVDLPMWEMLREPVS